MSRMATDIYFAGATGQKPLILNVDESPDLVMRALAGAKGHPFPLHRQGGTRSTSTQPPSVLASVVRIDVHAVPTGGARYGATPEGGTSTPLSPARLIQLRRLGGPSCVRPLPADSGCGDRLDLDQPRRVPDPGHDYREGGR
jgi:hypothetical protein